jgi:hypothetical protein
MADAVLPTSAPGVLPTGAPAQQGVSITTDRGLLNQLVSRLSSDTGSQSDDLVGALDAVLAAINAKPSA